MTDDPRIDKTVHLMRQAFILLQELDELRASMPEAAPDRRPSITREDRVRAYAVVVRTLEAQLRLAFQQIGTELPPLASGMTNEEWLRWVEEWLRWVDEGMGPEAPGAK